MMGILSRIAKYTSVCTPRLRHRNCFHHHQLKPNLVGLFTPYVFSFSTSPSKKRNINKADEEPKQKAYTIDDSGDIEDQHECQYVSFLASPLVQFFSVSIDTYFDDRRPCRLYGSIRATEGEDYTSYNLYDRKRNKPQTILKHGNLSLSGPQWSNLTCSIGNTTTKLDLYLKDRTRNIEVIKGQLNLDSNTEEIENSYDQLKKAVIEGEHGFAKVNYATFRFAVYANVEVAIFAKYDVSRPFSEIYGTIVAGYCNSKSYKCNDEELKCMRSILFSKSAEESVQASVGTPISLSRCVVAVPAFCSLKIEAQLWDSQDCQFASGFAEFLDCHSASTKLIMGEGGSVVVAVTWDNAFDRSYSRENKKKPLPKMIQDQSSPPSTTPLRRKLFIIGTPLVEVFSIFVDSQTKVSSVCGSVGVSDIQYRPQFFDRDLSDPDFCSSDKSVISLAGHPDISYGTNYFGLLVHLKDPISGLEISNGGVNWLYIRPGGFGPWYDKHVCSIIKGAHGYAAMHHTTFKKACNAFMEMTIFFPGHTFLSANIYGSVFARYGSYDYSSFYNKKYYQITLFDKPQEEPVELTTHSNKIPLLKHVVAVPLHERLIVEAKLWVSPTCNGIPTKEADVVYGIVEFEVEDEEVTMYKKFEGQSYNIQMSADFRDEWSL